MQDKILLVDDEVNILKSLERLLRRSGFQVSVAENGAAALALLEQQRFQVVISDFRMPAMNGGELLKQIKQLYPNSVCMILSGYADFNAVIDLLNSGSAFRFLQKPWDDEQLLNEVNTALAHYHQQRGLQIRNQFLISSNSPLLEVDYNGVVWRHNAAAENILRLTAPELTNQNILKIFQNIDSEQLCAFLHEKHTFLPATLFGDEIEIQVQKADKDFVLLKLQKIASATELYTNTVSSPAVLDQMRLVRYLDDCLLKQKTFAVISLQLKDFHLVCDVIGMRQAEQVFDEIAAELLEQMKMLGQLAYLANEQFVLVMEDYSSESELHQQMLNLLAALQDLACVKTVAVNLHYAVCYVLAPDDGASGKILLNNLLYTSRLQIKASQSFFMRYNAAISANSKKRYQLSEALYNAVENQELSLVFQPKWDLATEQIVGAEALLRWHNPEYGQISPAVFIEIAEQDGQIFQLGRWVLQKTCALLEEWRKKGGITVPLAVNVSVKELQQADFLQETLQLLSFYQIAAQEIQLEITESAVMTDFSSCMALLTSLQQAGFTLAIDDFGTGYSSLAYLSRLPAEVLKIDRSLIDDLDCNFSTQTMLLNITRMAHDLNKTVVVEGVETAEQLSILKNMACDQVQGFYLSRPLPEAEFVALLQSQKR